MNTDQYIFDSSPVVMIMTDQEGQIYRANDYALRFFKVSDLKQFVLSSDKLFPDAILSKMIDSYEFINTKNNYYDSESILFDANGTAIQSRIFLIKNPDQSGKYLFIIQDITQYKNLIEENELLAVAFAKNNQPMIITDKESRIIKVNAALEYLYGYKEEELAGQKINKLNPGRETYRDLGFSDEEYDNLFKGLWKDLLNPEIGKWDGKVINRTKKGRLIWARLLITAVFNEQLEVDHFIGMPVDISKTMEELASTKVGLYQAIADLAEMRDNETGNHMKRIGYYSRMMAEELGMPKKYCDDIELFAPLHDIGKVGISDSILLAERKLTPEEFEGIKNHTIFGFQIVKDKEEMLMASDIILNHHEKYDGSGYPAGKKAEEIPLSARITAIADVYDALRSKRPYKNPWSHDDAVKEIIASSGTHFDPRLITVFIKLEQKFETICENVKD